MEVEYYKGGELYKKWYIGFNMVDYYGMFMLLEILEQGKSDLLIIVEIKGLQGIIGLCYFVDFCKWVCIGIFVFQLVEIKEVDVWNIEYLDRSFNVQCDGKKFFVMINGKLYFVIDINMVFCYLNNYQKVYYNLKNYELIFKQVDSVRKLQFFMILIVKELCGKIMRFCFFYFFLGNLFEDDVDVYGDLVKWDQNLMWVELFLGELVKVQFFVFGFLIEGCLYWQEFMIKVS